MRGLSRYTGWGILVIFFSVTMLWVLTTPDPRNANRTYQNIMAMSNAAFQEAIIFAHLKFHLSKNSKVSKLNLVEVNEQWLDYNEQGFPVGVEHDEQSVQLPIVRRDCRDLWMALLIPMRPYLVPEESATLEVSARQGKCVFTSIKYTDQRIIYDPKSGKVSLHVL